MSVMFSPLDSVESETDTRHLDLSALEVFLHF